MPVDAPEVLAFAEDTDQLIKEYQSFVHSIRIDEDDPTKVNIETKERASLIVQISGAGWKVLAVQPEDAPIQVRTLKGETYEGPEAMLMAASDEFQRLWHESLMAKLSALSNFAGDD